MDGVDECRVYDIRVDGVDGVNGVYGFWEFGFGICAPRSCTRDEGRPLEVGLQEQASNHLKLHWLRAIVVSVEEKA